MRAILGALVVGVVAGSVGATPPDASSATDGEIGPAPPRCAPDSERPDAAVRRVFGELARASRLDVPGPAGERLRERRREQIAGRSVDVDAFAAAAVGEPWEEAPGWQRRRWRISLDALLQNRYLERLRDPTDHQLTVEDTSRTCDGALVDARLTRRRDGARWDLQLELRWSGDRWRAWDVVVDGASLVATYRSRFARIARADGLEGLDRQLTSIARRYGVALPAPPPPPPEGDVESAEAVDAAEG
ncbi:MAG: ABC transporter substrate-binding protein [Myxococcota bacterium]